LGLLGGSQRLGDKGFWAQLGIAVLGSVIILAVYRLISGRQAE
jgi:uncharacterized membrane protein YeaQ/YmgE (transglycosylase-associated protein family)